MDVGEPEHFCIVRVIVYRIWYHKSLIKTLIKICELFKVTDSEDKNDIRQSILSLPVIYRQVVDLYYIQELKVRDIADMLKIAVKPFISNR